MSNKEAALTIPEWYRALDAYTFDTRFVKLSPEAVAALAAGADGGEKVDIVKYSENPEEFIAAAISPAKAISVTVDQAAFEEGRKEAEVIVDESQLSLAIGKEGLNAKLAARLTGWKIDIKSGKSEADGE